MHQQYETIPNTIPNKAGAEAGAQNTALTPSVWLALASLSLAMLLSALGTSIANVALPTLTQAFSVPFQAVQWVVLACLLATTTLIVSVGRIGDIVLIAALSWPAIFLV